MSTPQVHIVAYCGDLGYGAARGAEMLSLMLGFGVVSRVGSGFLADRFGGMPTLLLGSVLQALALLLYVRFNSLDSLYIISAMFGLVQGGIVPSYAVVVRESFPASEAGAGSAPVLMATILGMAIGGWLSGAIERLDRQLSGRLRRRRGLERAERSPLTPLGLLLRRALVQCAKGFSPAPRPGR